MLAAMGKLKICKTASCSDSQLQAQLETEAIVFTEDTAPQLQLPRISGASNKPGGQCRGSPSLGRSSNSNCGVREGGVARLWNCGVPLPNTTQNGQGS